MHDFVIYDRLKGADQNWKEWSRSVPMNFLKKGITVGIHDITCNFPPVSPTSPAFADRCARFQPPFVPALDVHAAPVPPRTPLQKHSRTCGRKHLEVETKTWTLSWTIFLVRKFPPAGRLHHLAIGAASEPVSVKGIFDTSTSLELFMASV